MTALSLRIEPNDCKCTSDGCTAYVSVQRCKHNIQVFKSLKSHSDLFCTCHLEYTMIHLHTWAILDFNLRGHIKERIDSLKYLILVSFLSQAQLEYCLLF